MAKIVFYIRREHFCNKEFHYFTYFFILFILKFVKYLLILFLIKEILLLT